MTFSVDERITSTCFQLADWPLSRVFLKNNTHYPWFILVPRQEKIRDIDQLTQPLQHILMDEISHLSSIIKNHFHPDKLNVGTLGNIVSQLHIHLIARFTDDDLWPHGVWQEAQKTTAYAPDILDTLLEELRLKLSFPLSAGESR